GEREQAGLLVLPAKASATNGAAAFIHRHLDELTGDVATALSRLAVGDRQQRVAVDGLDVAVAQDVERGAEGANGFEARYSLFRLRTNGPVIDQRAVGNRVCPIVDGDAGVHKVPKDVLVAGTELGDLADSACHGV